MAYKVFCSDDGHRHRQRGGCSHPIVRIGFARARARPPSLERLLPLPPTRSPSGMSDVNFRKIDIDAYDEDVLVETELYDADPRGPAQVLNDVKQKATAVRSALSK